MLRILIPYLSWWVRLGYRLGHGAAHRVLRLVPMPPLVRHQLAGTVALIPYLWVVWGFTMAFDFTWRADVIAGLITAGMLLVVHRVEVNRAGIGR
ncbi:hypothetical protein GCM10011374_23460 [Kocuria dechangensis]|uniref:Uncharacterized protein n=1 Tax=Kocuria dechangensis TaxID=1176249 RepID=A0A917GX98_9MICC|nr:hypothetical protein [Kocuria dechangensis]GGG59914.1 hypothetical protein GCM10011374_23460 [Kocuria dechangensis]